MMVITSDLAAVRVVTDVTPVSHSDQFDTCHMAIADRTFSFLFTTYEIYFM